MKINEQKVTKRTPTQIPSGGMGNGLERSYSKNNFIKAEEIVDEKKTKIHNAGSLISPTMHLFPLLGQSGSRGVSIKFTLIR